MDYDFARAITYADQYEREEILEYLLMRMGGNSVLDSMKAKVFIEHMSKYSLEELEKRLK